MEKNNKQDRIGNKKFTITVWNVVVRTVDEVMVCGGFLFYFYKITIHNY